MALVHPTEVAAAMLSQAICRYLCDDDPVAEGWIHSTEFTHCCKLLELNWAELRGTIQEARAIGKPLGVVPNTEPCHTVHYAKVFNCHRARKTKEG